MHLPPFPEYQRSLEFEQYSTVDNILNSDYLSIDVARILWTPYSGVHLETFLRGKYRRLVCDYNLVNY